MRDRNFTSDLDALNREFQAKTHERKSVLEEAYRLKAQTEELRFKVDALQRDADSLAVQFKEKFDEASAAYGEGDGELAKECSLEGRELQELCKGANERTKVLRAALHEVQSAMLRHFDQAKRLEREIDDIRKRLSTAERQKAQQCADVEVQRRIARAITLTGFPQEEAVAIRSVLGSFSPTILHKLDRIVYTPQMAQGRYGPPITGRTKQFPGGRYFVEVFRHDARFGERMSDTIAHELGHIAFAMLSPERRKVWEDLSSSTDDSQFVSRYAMRDCREDFCECLMFFIANLDTLAAKDKRKYAFMKRLREERCI